VTVVGIDFRDSDVSPLSRRVPHATYLFKHSLVQDAAYATLLRSDRQQLHVPTDKAVAYGLKAGKQAMARSAMTEAVAQLRKSLDVLTGLPDALGAGNKSWTCNSRFERHWLSRRSFGA
jgi:predicted ATPase